MAEKPGRRDRPDPRVLAELDQAIAGLVESGEVEPPSGSPPGSPFTSSSSSWATRTSRPPSTCTGTPTKRPTAWPPSEPPGGGARTLMASRWYHGWYREAPAPVHQTAQAASEAASALATLRCDRSA